MNTRLFSSICGGLVVLSILKYLEPLANPPAPAAREPVIKPGLATSSLNSTLHKAQWQPNASAFL